MALVCVDAGHYGKYNRSPVNSEYYESYMTWDLHVLLRAELEARGVNVRVTRDDQTKDLEVTKRGKAAKGCDLFISLHSNAASNSDGTPYKGTRVCGIHQLGDYGYAVKSKEFANIVAPAVCECMELERAKVYDKAGSNGKDYYGVLRGAAAVGVPAIILECGFHTNYDTTVWLLDSDNLAKLAKTIAKSIAEFFGITEPLPGDVNGDGLVDNQDAAALRSAIVSGNPAVDDILEVGDLNGDGRISVADYALLKRKISKK